MPIISEKEKTSWVTCSVKLTPELMRAVEEFMEISGESLTSTALRMLIGAGLDSELHQQINVIRAVQANADAKALHKAAYWIENALVNIRRDEPIPGSD